MIRIIIISLFIFILIKIVFHFRLLSTKKHSQMQLIHHSTRFWLEFMKVAWRLLEYLFKRHRSLLDMVFWDGLNILTHQLYLPFLYGQICYLVICFILIQSMNIKFYSKWFKTTDTKDCRTVWISGFSTGRTTNNCE